MPTPLLYCLRLDLIELSVRLQDNAEADLLPGKSRRRKLTVLIAGGCDAFVVFGEPLQDHATTPAAAQALTSITPSRMNA